MLFPLNQRIVKMATNVYKAISGYKVLRGIGELLHERSTNYNLRGKHILELPKVNTTTYGLKSWRYTAAKIWNALPDQFRTANKIGTFKNLISKGDVTRDDSQRRFLAQHSVATLFRIVTSSGGGMFYSFSLRIQLTFCAV